MFKELSMWIESLHYRVYYTKPSILVSIYFFFWGLAPMCNIQKPPINFFNPF